MTLNDSKWVEHPAVRTENQLSRGERAADGIRNAMGSWKFIIWQTVIVALWMAANGFMWAFRWDPYPWILLNLMFSLQAAYASPIILLAGRRSDQRASELAVSDHEIAVETRGMVEILLNKSAQEGK